MVETDGVRGNGPSRLDPVYGLAGVNNLVLCPRKFPENSENLNHFRRAGFYVLTTVSAGI